MAYISSLKLFLKFNNASLYEEISATYMNTYDDESSPSYNRGSAVPSVLPDGAGYIMTNNQYLVGEGISNNGYILGISSSMTIGFWLYPVNPGFATNSANGNAESITMPLIDLVNLNSNLSIFNITEHTSDNNENYITTNIGNYRSSSEKYSIGLWHHILLMYNGNLLYIYIDGKLQILQNTFGSLPSNIDGSNINLYINRYRDGYDYNIAKNYGYIDDIFVLSDSGIGDSNIQRIINNGPEYVFDTNFNTKIIDGYGIYFNDPTTITVNSATNDMNYIYLGRNDGKIMKGSPLLWEVRKTYSNPNEVELVDSIDESDIVNGFLKINNKMVRL